MITAGLLLTAVAHPGMLFPNETLERPVPADIVNDPWSNVSQTSLRGSQLLSAARICVPEQKATNRFERLRRNVQRKNIVILCLICMHYTCMSHQKKKKKNFMHCSKMPIETIMSCSTHDKCYAFGSMEPSGLHACFGYLLCCCSLAC